MEKHILTGVEMASSPFEAHRGGNCGAWAQLPCSFLLKGPFLYMLGPFTINEIHVDGGFWSLLLGIRLYLSIGVKELPEV